MVGERVFGAPQGRFFLFGGVKHHFRVKMQSFLFDFETLGVGDKFVELSLGKIQKSANFFAISLLKCVDVLLDHGLFFALTARKRAGQFHHAASF